MVKQTLAAIYKRLRRAGVPDRLLPTETILIETLLALVDKEKLETWIQTYSVVVLQEPPIKPKNG
jgi:hypothetical protein